MRIVEMQNKLEGFKVLYWVTLKQSFRIMWPWIIAIILLSVSSFVAYERVFPTTEDQQILNITVQSNPAFNLIFGQADNLLTPEGFTAWRSLALGSFLACMMTILLVAKHTREKEDSGEEEMLASGVVGRYALTLVAMCVALTACMFVMLLVALPLIGLGANVAFSFLLSLAIAMCGVVFAIVAAIAAQIVSHSRTVVSFSVITLGIAYLLRGIADTVDAANWMSYLSPIGWVQKTHPATETSFLPIVALAILTVALSAIAFIFKARRDFGQGIIVDAPGSDRAGRSGTISGLALRLHRSSIVGWSFAFVFLGAAFGYLLDSVGSSFADNKGLSSFVSASSGSDVNFTFQFASTLLNILGIIVATYGTQVIFRLYNEERFHRIESLLAGSLQRTKLFRSHASIALIGPVVAMLLAVSSIIATVTLNSVDISISHLFYQSLLTIPATLVLVGIAVATIGISPKFRWLAWLGIGVSFGLTLLGPILQLNEKVLALSPFWHVQNASSPNISILSVFVLITISIVFVATGFIGYKRRDIARV